MMALAVAIGIGSAVSGYWLARALDTNIAGAMATMTGVIFLLTFLAAPQRGIVARMRRHTRQKWEFAQVMLTIHLMQHEGGPDAATESRVDHLVEHIRWQPAFAEQVVRYAERKGTVRRHSGALQLTEEGRILAQQRLVVT
jgi:manganese/zinc/iron transport system permease protein